MESWLVPLILVTVTEYVFIFQMEHISAVKFVVSYEKNRSSLVIPKSPKVWKKCEQTDWAGLL